ncbi:MAG TPA: hypothetical protein VF178_11905 [Gemmatimonadaceae bacterium]
MFTDAEGLLWVDRSFPGDTRTRLHVVGRDGAVIAEVELPRRVRMFEIGSDYIIGAYEAEPHVVVYRLRRAPSGHPI